MINDYYFSSGQSIDSSSVVTSLISSRSFYSSMCHYTVSITPTILLTSRKLMEQLLPYCIWLPKTSNDCFSQHILYFAFLLFCWCK